MSSSPTTSSSTRRSSARSPPSSRASPAGTFTCSPASSSTRPAIPPTCTRPTARCSGAGASTAPATAGGAGGRRARTLVELMPVADPDPLGLAGFALTTFMLSGHNATFIPDILWVGLALFYGGVAQLLAGMWEFRNRNVFGATAFSTYGGFWLGLGITVVLLETTKIGAALKP